MNNSIKTAVLCSAFFYPSFDLEADVTFNVDPAATWLGYMNVFELPENGGALLSGSGWGTADLTASFSGSTLTLGPNTIGDPNEYWYQDPTMSGNPNPGGPGAPGNKTMDANFYVEAATGTLAGETVTFEGTVLSNTLTSAHVARAFIRDFAPDYSSFNESTVELAPGPFSINLFTDPGVGRHVQYGFNFNGPNVWITDVAPFGTVVIQAETEGPLFEADFNGDGQVNGADLNQWQDDYGVNDDSDADGDGDSDGRDFLVWQRQYGSGVPVLAAVSAVPEPSGLWILAGLASSLMFRRARLVA